MTPHFFVLLGFITLLALEPVQVLESPSSGRVYTAPGRKPKRKPAHQRFSYQVRLKLKK